MEKHSNCPSFWKFESHQTSSVMLVASSTRCVDSRIRQRYFLSWTLDRTCVKRCTTVKKQILCTSLSPCGRQGIDCHSHDPTFSVQFLNCTRELRSCSVSVKDTTRLRLFRKTDSFPPRPLACFCLCLPCCSCLLFVLLLVLVLLSGAPPLDLQQSFIQCPVLPQFLRVLMSVLLVLQVLRVLRVPFWF